MSTRSDCCAADRRRLIDEYYLENRARLLDLAAFLDRLDRAEPAFGSGPNGEDFRVQALREGLQILLDKGPNRVARIHGVLSDPTREPVTEAAGKGASGAYRPLTAEVA